MKTSDPWFRGIDLITGADGGVYIADWSDIGECHDNDGIHRSSGRIYKIVYGKPRQPAVPDVAKLSDEELIAAISSERVVGPPGPPRLANRYATDKAPKETLDRLVNDCPGCRSRHKLRAYGACMHLARRR